MDYDLGYFDLESNKVQALDNPFGPKVLGVWAVKSVNHVLGIVCKPCDRYTPFEFGGPGQNRTTDTRIFNTKNIVFYSRNIAKPLPSDLLPYTHLGP
jgi:hypothetical protein